MYAINRPPHSAGVRISTSVSRWIPIDEMFFTPISISKHHVLAMTVAPNSLAEHYVKFVSGASQKVDVDDTDSVSIDQLVKNVTVH